MVALRVALTSLALALAACSVGEVPIGGPMGGPDAPTMGSPNDTSFNTTMKPLVSPRCTGCHGGTQAPNLTSFAALQPQYKMKPGAQNTLVTKAATLQNNVHEGIQYFSPTELQTVTTWIDGLQ